MKSKKNIILIGIIFIIIVLGILNILMKKNLLLVIEGFFIILFVSIYIYTNEKRLFFFTFWSVMLSKLISDYISQVEYSLYICTILLVIKLLEKKFIKREKLNYDKLIIILTAILFIINIISIIYNGYTLGIGLILFGTLKKFSFIILYLYYLNTDVGSESIILNFKLMLIFSLIQFPVLISQFFAGLTQDDISGMFGVSGTGVLLQYFINTMLLLPILNKECKKIKIPYLVFAITILFYCAIAEVKLGFILIPIVYILMLIFEGRFIKVILKSSILFFTVTVIYSYFISIYPEHDFITKKEFTKEYLEIAYGSNQVNRSNFMPLLNDTILTSEYKRAFGTGLATVNPSGISSLEGPIAKEYSYMNIHFFSLPYSIVENGLIGTILWISIYLYLFLKSLYKYFKIKNIYSVMIVLICFVIGVFIYYDSSIITSNVLIMQVWFILSIVERWEMEVA